MPSGARGACRSERFGGLSRAGLLEALRAEGVPASGGYTPLNRAPSVVATLASPAFMRVYGQEALATLAERNHCPENDRLCDEAVRLTQTMLLGTRRDMDDIVAAVQKVRMYAPVSRRTCPGRKPAAQR